MREKERLLIKGNSGVTSRRKICAAQGMARRGQGGED